jgi:hypothetical protein
MGGRGAGVSLLVAASMTTTPLSLVPPLPSHLQHAHLGGQVHVQLLQFVGLGGQGGELGLKARGGKGGRGGEG